MNLHKIHQRTRADGIVKSTIQQSRGGSGEMESTDLNALIKEYTNLAFHGMRSPGAERSAQGDSYEPKLTVRTQQKDDTVTIKIQDNGSGIPDKIKDKILQPFLKTKKGTAGTGLGLSITNDIIKAHGGELKIDSSPGEKTTFTIHLEKKS